jgi:hypothetical protein
MLCIAKYTQVMSDLNQALVDIRAIRRQMAEATEFRGYGPLTLLGTAFSAVAAGAVQAYWVPEPASHPWQYVALWLGTGVLCAALIVAQMLTRANRLHSGMADEMIRMAVAQFLPAAAAGAILPFVLLRAAPGEIWMLPALWQIVFSLGVFASCRCLPRAMYLAGAWFLFAGMACVAVGGARALAPAAMSIPYAVGMALVAGIHHFSQGEERTNEDEER